MQPALGCQPSTWGEMRRTTGVHPQDEGEIQPAEPNHPEKSLQDAGTTGWDSCTGGSIDISAAAHDICLTDGFADIFVTVRCLLVSPTRIRRGRAMTGSGASANGLSGGWPGQPFSTTPGRSGHTKVKVLVRSRSVCILSALEP